MLSRFTLRKQITLLGVALVTLTVFCLLTASIWKTVSLHNQQVSQRILSAENVLTEYLTAREELLFTASKVLTADFGFKQAVATRDKGTIASVLENHGSRINANLMAISDLNGHIISSNINGLSIDAEFKKNLNNINKTQLKLINGNLYQLIILPINAPRVIAYSIIGFQIDQAFADELKRLMAIEVSFYHQDELIITTLHKEEKIESEYFHEIERSWLLFTRKLYENKSIIFTGSQNHQYTAKLSVNLSSSYAELDKLISIVLLLSLAIFGITAFASSIVARSLTKPLEYLTELTKDYSLGNYEHSSNVSNGSVEVNRVYQSFVEMGKRLQRRERKISYQANHDSLTDVYSRSTFIDRLSVYIANTNQNEKYSIMVFGINIRDFKRINDSLGSDVGDLTLKAVALRIKDIYQENVLMVGRFSGDEFYVAMKLITAEEQTDIIDSFLDYLVKPMQVNKLWLNLNFRIGICLFPEQSCDVIELVRRTTIAIEAARSESKTIRHYKNGEDEAHLERLELLEDLRTALTNDDGELFMVYQPKLSFETGKIEKAESLIRWVKPDGQFVSPELFIDLAEQSGLIIQLTHWVIESVFKQIQEWQVKNIKLKVAINISAQDITHADFIDFIFDKMTKHNIEPCLITLEITERDIMINEDLVVNRLKQLKQIGIQVSVDDYGIGQSSLGKLKQLPIDELKIDKTFILELNKSVEDQYIVKSTIELCHQLKLSVVAEGVENQASLDMLKVMKCDQAQGYFISRPIKSAELLNWLDNYEEK